MKGEGTSSIPWSIVNDEAVHSHFNLSQNKHLRTLETTAESMIHRSANPSFLKIVLSTITSTLPLDITIIYQHYDFGYLFQWWEKPVPTVEGWGGGDSYGQQQFKVLQEMYMVRGFQLVLCADVLDGVTEYTIQGLKQAVEKEKVNGGFDYLPCEPSIISKVCSPHTRLSDDCVGGAGRSQINASAL